MFFFFSKTLLFLITPLIWIIAFLLHSYFSKNSKSKKRSLVICISLLLFFSNSFILDEAMRGWEVPTKTYAQLETYDAAIVLGTFLTYDKDYDRIQFRDGATDRLLQAIELYKIGKVKKIVYSGGSGSILHPDEKEGNFVKRYLLTLGIPESDVFCESEAMNTRQNAVNVKNILDKNFKGGKFLLITSACHMRRAEACFMKEGMSITTYSTDRKSGPRKFEFDHLFLPKTGVLTDWETLNHEMIGYLVYKIAGYS